MYTEPLYASMFQMLNCNLYKVVEKVETSQVGWGGGACKFAKLFVACFNCQCVA